MTSTRCSCCNKVLRNKWGQLFLESVHEYGPGLPTDRFKKAQLVLCESCMMEIGVGIVEIMARIEPPRRRSKKNDN